MTERYLAENWLLSAGVLPDTSVQTLMLYGYAQKGVTKVALEVDQHNAANGVKYKITLSPFYSFRWKKYCEAKADKGEIFKRLRMLWWAWMGAPVDIDKNVLSLAKTYLPPNFNVSVEVI